MPTLALIHPQALGAATDLGVWAHSGSRVLAPEDLTSLQSAQDLLARCLAQGQALVQRAQADAAALQRQAHAQGLAQATQELQTRLWQIERSHAQAQADQQAQRPQELADLVMLVLERLAPALAPGELIRSLAQQAVAHATPSQRVVLKVHPDAVAAVQAEMQTLCQHTAWLDNVKVLAVEGMAADECLLETPHGFVSASWPKQLQAMRQLVRDALLSEAAADPVTNRVTNQVTNQITDSVTDSVTDSLTDPVTNPASDPMPAPSAVSF
jgi:flagellar biosynthesis/type III secretory pathway protein FliH